MTIRRQPEDFRVDECCDEAFLAALSQSDASPRAWAIYRLEKRSLTTHEAVAQLAKAMGVRAGLLLAPALKDKHAVTTQLAGVPRRAWNAAACEPPQLLESTQWRAEFLGWSQREPDVSILLGNRFAIVIRALSTHASARIDDRARHLADASDPQRLLFTNYFGDQRFGSARHGQGFAARALLDADPLRALQLLIAAPSRKDTTSFRTFTRLAASHWGAWQDLARTLPPRPEKRAVEALARGATPLEAFAQLPHSLQQLSLDAYQSFLWNAIARGLITSCVPDATRIEAEDDFGTMTFAPPVAIPPAVQAAELPMPRAGAHYEPWITPHMNRVLSAEGLTLAQLRAPKLPAAFATHSRPLLAAATAVTISPAERDEFASPRSPNRWKRTLHCSLPRGTFATVLLRALGE